MTSSLVGSEMCIRDSFRSGWVVMVVDVLEFAVVVVAAVRCGRWVVMGSCLLYTSDAADDM
eukprot:11653843-Prorocentrum_lima.AAC.1